jgi:hypothetical protein
MNDRSIAKPENPIVKAEESFAARQDHHRFSVHPQVPHDADEAHVFYGRLQK